MQRGAVQKAAQWGRLQRMDPAQLTVVDLAELANDVALVARVDELEVLDRRHSHAPVKVEAVIAVFEHGLLAPELAVRWRGCGVVRRARGWGQRRRRE